MSALRDLPFDRCRRHWRFTHAHALPYHRTARFASRVRSLGGRVRLTASRSRGGGGERLSAVLSPSTRKRSFGRPATGCRSRRRSADSSPCADYYISIPPQAADKTALRGLQDDLVRALGPRIHPVAEITLGTLTGWNHWVNAVPGRTWFGAGVEFRRRIAAAGYRFDLGETWLLNEFDRSTRRDEPPYTRAAMRDLLRGLYDGNGTQPVSPGIVEIGIAYTHQNIPNLAQYKAEMRSWLEDSAFWGDVAPKIRILTKETYPDARFRR